MRIHGQTYDVIPNPTWLRFCRTSSILVSNERAYSKLNKKIQNLLQIMLAFGYAMWLLYNDKGLSAD